MYTLPFTKLIKDNDHHFDHGIDYLGVSTRAIRVGLKTIKNQPLRGTSKESFRARPENFKIICLLISN